MLPSLVIAELDPAIQVRPVNTMKLGSPGLAASLRPGDDGQKRDQPAPPVKIGKRAASPPMMNSTAIEAMIRPMTRLKMVMAVGLI